MARRFKEILSSEERAEVVMRKSGIYHSGGSGKMSARSRLAYGAGRIAGGVQRVRSSKNLGTVGRIAKNLSDSDFFLPGPRRKGRKPEGFMY